MDYPPLNEPGPNIFLMGEIGSGKTASIRTLVNSGLEVFLIATEQGYAEILGDLPSDKLHWHFIQSYGKVNVGDKTTETFMDLKASVKLLQSYDMEQIKKMPGMDRGRYNQFANLLEVVNNFKDDRTGKEYGDVGNFTPQQALVIDGLSGINNMAVRLVAGNKPCMSWPEYDAIQFCIEQFINTLAQSLKCWFVITSHIEWEPDPNSQAGLRKIMPATVGQKLAPRLTKFFSEAILCRRTVENGKARFVWDNLSQEVTVKFRNLPQAANHTPDFGVIKANWEKKVMFS